MSSMLAISAPVFSGMSPPPFYGNMSSSADTMYQEHGYQMVWIFSLSSRTNHDSIIPATLLASHLQGQQRQKTTTGAEGPPPVVAQGFP